MRGELLTIVELHTLANSHFDHLLRSTIDDLPAFGQPVDAFEIRSNGEELLVEERGVVGVDTG